jgi:hypothetical protein
MTSRCPERTVNLYKVVLMTARGFCWPLISARQILCAWGIRHDVREGF